MGVAAIAGLFAGAFSATSAPTAADPYAVAPSNFRRSRRASKPGRTGAKLAKQAGKARVGLRTSAR